MSLSSSQPVSPDEARAHLHEVDEANRLAAQWRPSRWAAALFAVTCGTALGAFLMGWFRLLLAAIAAVIFVAVALRNQLFRPGVRTRDDVIDTNWPWWKRHSLLAWFILIAPTLRGFDPHPVLVGVLAVLAAAHAWYCATVIWPENSRA
ncbi:hypothetical protein [Actinomyces sp. MRS3W]|uniref:hypothetical protein n=1 Tax=Actinomyces sp. MRS3W TaxID=2800796 RepID=UPI0028FD695B|nr:hypothetical protein [Actinomyces sp. MRS3W]MDU0348540.1 hypothetical protein [Actinomyces sp. MRS3W]